MSMVDHIGIVPIQKDDIEDDLWPDLITFLHRRDDLLLIWLSYEYIRRIIEKKNTIYCYMSPYRSL